MQKCTHCQKSIPTVHVLDVQGGQVVRAQALCEACAESLGVVQPKASTLHLSQEILENLLGGLKSSKPESAGGTPPEDAERTRSDAACPACGLTRQEFKTRGRLGCARCYETFRPHLVRLFERVHDATRHSGRFPGRTDAPAPLPDSLAELRGRLRAAIAEERYRGSGPAARRAAPGRRVQGQRGAAVVVNELPQIPPDYAMGEWLRGEGPESDIAVCTRVRFARNSRDHRFSTILTSTEARELVDELSRVVESLPLERPLHFVDVAAMQPLAREVLVERHLISRELARSEMPRGLATDTEETTSVMINEEDHLRSQTFRSGFRAAETYAAAEALDDALIARLNIAFSEEFGFLTACPTNAGTGLRVSVMLHLPGLVWTEDIGKAANTCQKIHLAVRGLYGEGSLAVGDFYQVSNQVTLGRGEPDILADVRTAVERLIEWERDVRNALLGGSSRGRTMDRVFRALGILEHAWVLSSEECLNNLSAVRFGVQQGLIEDLAVRDLNQILLLSQPAHLQQTFGERLGPEERDERRARLVRAILERARTAGS